MVDEGALLGVLADEIAAILDEIPVALGGRASSPGDESVDDVLTRFVEHIELIEQTSEAFGLIGLQAVCARILANITQLSGSTCEHDFLVAVVRAPVRMAEYLRDSRNQQAVVALVDFLAEPHWPEPIDDSDRQELIDALGNVAVSLPEAEGEPEGPKQHEPDDLALDITPDVNPVLLDAFLAESPQHTATVSRLIEQVTQGDASVATLNEARRLVHTLKGAANTIGIRGIATLAHHFEALIEHLVERSVSPDALMGKVMMDVADQLEMMVESIAEDSAPPELTRGVLEQLRNAIDALDRGQPLVESGNDGRLTDVAATVSASNDVHGSNSATVTAEEERETGQQPGQQAVPEVANARKASPARGEIARKIRVPASTIDELLRLSGEMTSGRAHVQERLHHAFEILAELRERHRMLQDRANEVERFVTLRGIAAGRQQAAGGEVVGSQLFDALELDQYSELHGAVYGFVETVADLRALEARLVDTLSTVDSAVVQEGLINTDLHEHVMHARMMPAGSIESRLARTIRQACEATGKRASFSLIGGDVMLDDRIVDDLINPLMHLLRNAVDHGIEDQATRQTAGKSVTGEITLTFKREGNSIVVRCADDGQGLDLAHVRSIAMDRGLIAPETLLSDEETARLILLPGFSTRAEVSQISGRGVGMDVVYSAVKKLKGDIEILQEPGCGCCFVLRLPMTMGRAHCLIVRAGKEKVAIPTDVLDRAVFQGATSVERYGERYMYRGERDFLEVYDLAHLLERLGDRSLGDAEDNRPVLVVNSSGGQKAVVVDSVLSGMDLVVKSLGRYLDAARGVIGAAVLGDGSVLPVLDISELLRMGQGPERVQEPGLARMPVEIRRPEAPINILVVDDSLTVRQNLAKLLEDEGYSVQTAKDGVEALEQVERKCPEALLVDLEMPRMNGLELTARLRRSQRTRNVPVIMVTSRSSEKHRGQAEAAGVNCYITKPYSEIGLLGQLHSVLKEVE